MLCDMHEAKGSHNARTTISSPMYRWENRSKEAKESWSHLTPELLLFPSNLILCLQQ